MKERERREREGKVGTIREREGVRKWEEMRLKEKKKGVEKRKKERKTEKGGKRRS